MNILAFESSCDETAAAVITHTAEGRFLIRSNIIASQIETHRLYGGVVPEIAGRAHIEAISAITYEALQAAGMTPESLDLVAVTSHPGLIGALLVAVNFAKAFAAMHQLPLVEVDHMKGHIAAAYIDRPPAEQPKPPFLATVLSGGHTAFYLAKSETEFETVGSTRDDAIGEAFDKIGRLIGIPYPAGAGFDRLAAEGFALATGKDNATLTEYKKSPAYKDAALALPSPALLDGSLDFSFSGLKTAAINLLHRYEQTNTPLPRALFAARYTYEAVEAVAKKLKTALTMYRPESLVVAGGVAANSHLRKRLAEVAEEAGIPLILPPISLCGDNGAMIGAAGYYEYMAGKRADSRLNASAADEI